MEGNPLGREEEEEPSQRGSGNTGQLWEGTPWGERKRRVKEPSQRGSGNTGQLWKGTPWGERKRRHQREGIR
ncbi:hypothetical protein GDO81_024240 [Engystomops pustulosus]|uniref:Uncharacterized protein n=1 Tax=Engystomops pustulosus TaxID=76066 RepID=A0AAV6ZHK3_ENGPU|nr:hypothetical protein GDO81_024240 [Engystomops pustulosus]